MFLLALRVTADSRALSVVISELLLVGFLCLIVGGAGTIGEEFEALVQWKVL